MNQLVKYIKSEIIATETAAFYFEKPADFIYRAGQLGIFTLVNPPETDEKGNSRAFSFASAPSEKYIMIATRMRNSAFKRVLRELKPGERINLEAPLGRLTLHGDHERPAVFLAGGIGITPFRSIIIDAIEKKLPHKIFLFYSNKKPEDAPFLNELKYYQEKNINYKLIATMTQSTEIKNNWSSETTYINIELLKKYLSDLTNPVFYLAGPSAMVIAMHKMLINNGVNSTNINIEKFTGYEK